MGLRFRKSIKLMPGVRINLNKNSSSITFGKRGAHYTINSKGRKTATVGLPGTGLSYSVSSNSRSRQQQYRKANYGASTTKVNSGVAIIIILLFIGAVIVSTVLAYQKEMLNNNPATNYQVERTTLAEKEKNISLIIDANRFIHITSEDLIAILGEPTEIQSKKTDIGDNLLFSDYFDKFNREVYSYIDDNKSELQFLVINNKIYSFIYWSPKHLDNTANDIGFEDDLDIFKMFNVTLSEAAKKRRTSRAAIYYESVTDDINEFEVSFIDRTKNTFQVVIIAYNIKDLAEEISTKQVEKDESRTVYITPSGEKYHFDTNCGGKNSFATTLNRAIDSGKDPCQKCAK